MARRKPGRKKLPPKVILNTTIDKKIMKAFRAKCAQEKMPMNRLIEMFMEQFAAGNFKLRIGKGNLGLELKDFEE